MKRVLVLTYYFPPAGGSGVQRPLKFVKYLREFGWEPVVYAPSNADYPLEDPKLFEDIPEGVEVIRRPIWEPYTLYKLLTGKSTKEKMSANFLSHQKKPGPLDSLMIWVRGNLFIPDARCLWVGPSVRYLKQYLKNYPVEAIYSTGPPHTMHVIGQKLRRKTGIPWLADFRDPWTEIDFYEDLKLSRWADKKHHRMERRVLKTADRVVAIGHRLAQSLKERGAEDVTVLPNGYDQGPELLNIAPDNKFAIAHIGILVNQRNPNHLWKVLGELVNERQDFRSDLELRFIGTIDYLASEGIRSEGLEAFCRFMGYLPHDKAMVEQRKTRILLLLVHQFSKSQMTIPGKVFEYLAAERPILCLGPEEGDAAYIVHNANAGAVLDYQDRKGIRAQILAWYEDFKNGELYLKDPHYQHYSRRNQTQQLAQILEEISH